MARPKIKDGRQTIFNLSEEERTICKQMATQKGCSQSDFIGFLIRNYSIKNDPIKEMDELVEEENKLHREIEKIKIKKSEVLDKMRLYKENEKELLKSKQKAIEILKRKLIEGSDRLEVENVARFWGMRLNIDSIQLTAEAVAAVSKGI